MKKLTITVEDDVYVMLHSQIGRGKISRFINEMAKERAQKEKRRAEIRAGYAAMAADEAYEREAKEWVEGLIGDVGDEPW